jgi:S-adenosylmethionine:diacylglycerol 3-amino-3-carboxypropyl transferase
MMQLCSIKMELSQKEIETNYQMIKFLIENGVSMFQHRQIGQQRTYIV